MADKRVSPRRSKRLAPRGSQDDLPPHLRKPAFVWSKKGRVLYATGPVCPMASVPAVQSLFDAVAAQFGHGLARVVCNAICFPPYRLPPLYSVGTRQRLNRLHDLIDLHGRFVPGSGFVGVGDDLRAVEAGAVADKEGGTE